MSFYTFFKNLYDTDRVSSESSHVNHATPPDAICDQDDFLSNLNRYVTLEEAWVVIKKLKSGKSSGEDLISNEMLKNLDNLAIEALVHIFNRCLDYGAYPWHSSVITPIHKTGDISNPDNYRAISVSSCIGKAFSTILLNRLIEFRDKTCPDPVTQLGFKKNAQTSDHILTLKTLIDKYRIVSQKKKGQYLTVCFVDFKKAFDTVSRDLLLFKISQLQIKGNFFGVLNDMYNNSSAKIKINKLLSPKFDI